MPVFTLAELRAAVRTLGDYDNSAKMTSAFVDDCINKAMAELYEIVTDTFQGQYTKTSTGVTVSGTQTVSLPVDFCNLRALDRSLGNDNYAEIRRVNLIESRRHGGRGTPVGYMLHGSTQPGLDGGTLRLFPIPDGVYTLRFTYDPLPPTLAADGDDFDFRNGWEEYVIHAALLRLDTREERPLGDRIALIERHKERIKGSAFKRDSAEPEYLTARGGHGIGWTGED